VNFRVAPWKTSTQDGFNVLYFIAVVNGRAQHPFLPNLEILLTSIVMSTVTGMLSRLQGQPESYDKKAKYRFGRTLGAGTYGIVREADGPTGKVAIKIILKKNVKGNERMVYDELDMLQRLKHPHIVRFVDWFESRDKYYIVTELATGGELFDRICEQGKFTEKDASQTIKQVLTAVDYLHRNNVVHRGEDNFTDYP
jgi:calcium/calmodulin-dependent protein kinase I